MAKTKKDKQVVVASLTDLVRGMKAAVFANYEGLTTKETDELRHKLRDESVGYTVAKKTLLGVAMKEAGIAIDPNTIEGNFATIVSNDDEVSAARIVASFAKDHEALNIRAGILEGRLIDRAAVLALAKLPTKLQLLAKFVGTINAPVSGFVNVLAGNIRGLVTVLGALRDQKTA